MNPTALLRAARVLQVTATVVLLMGTMGCERGSLQTNSQPGAVPLTDAQIARLATKKIIFGHQSIGNDIVQGIRDLMRTDPRLKLNLVKSRDPLDVPGPAFVEFEVGLNKDPRSKDLEFAEILDRGLGSQPAIAMFKYCYVDVDAATDVARLFDGYHQTIESLQEKHPDLTMVAVTIPLTTVEASPKVWIKSWLGRPTAREMNAKRNEFNELVRRTYAGSGPLFDLAAGESTHADGSRSFFTRNHKPVYTLAPEYTSDGEHLNEAGRRVVAEQMLLALSEL